MKLQLFLGRASKYTSQNWTVSVDKVNLSSITPSTVPGMGYGGYGWNVNIASTADLEDVKVSLHKNEDILNSYQLDADGRCIIAPDGGSIDDYRLTIYTVEPEPEEPDASDESEV
jgi:hypothetical protein